MKEMREERQTRTVERDRLVELLCCLNAGLGLMDQLVDSYRRCVLTTALCGRCVDCLFAVGLLGLLVEVLLQ